MNKLTQAIIGTREDIHVEVSAMAPFAFWITLGAYHHPLLSSSPQFSTSVDALEAGWKIVHACQKELAQ